MEKCTKCGSSRIDKGYLTTVNDPSTVAHRSKRKKWLRFPTLITSYVCLECGYTEVNSDIEHLKKRIE